MKRKLFLMFGMMALLVSCHSDVDELNINNPRSYAIRLDGESIDALIKKHGDVGKFVFHRKILLFFKIKRRQACFFRLDGENQRKFYSADSLFLCNLLRENCRDLLCFVNVVIVENMVNYVEKIVESVENHKFSR